MEELHVIRAAEVTVLVVVEWVGDGADEGFGLLACREVRKYVRDEIVKWRKVPIDAKMPREVN